TADGDAADVSIFLGNGDGTLKAATTFTTITGQRSVGNGLNPGDIMVGDFNRDGKLDIATISQGAPDPQSVITTLLGHGDGTFAAPIQEVIPNGAIDSATLGDVNGDGLPDIVTANSTKLSIFLGNGTAFGSEEDIATTPGGFFDKIAALDVNGDGKADILVPTGDGPLLYINNGNGTFQAGQPLGGGSNAISNGFFVGDFNGDGRPDLALVNAPADKASILLNDPNAPTPTITESNGTILVSGTADSDV